MAAWHASGLQTPAAALVLVGVGSSFRAIRCRRRGGSADARGWSASTPSRRWSCATSTRASDVLVLPSIPDATFREPWGLVVNEAMNQGLAVIATDAVGAAAGGLVRDGRNGLVVPAGDSARARAGALTRLAGDGALRRGWAQPAQATCAHSATTPGRRASREALATVGLSRGRW